MNNNNNSSLTKHYDEMIQSIQNAVDLFSKRMQKQMERNKVERSRLERERLTQKFNKFVLTETIMLNVGGTIFSTSLTTLTSQKGSLFDSMFSSAFESKKESDGSIFIDRNPKHFGYILDYLRGSFPPVENFSKREIDELKIEADFYQLTALLSLLFDDETSRDVVASLISTQHDFPFANEPSVVFSPSPTSSPRDRSSPNDSPRTRKPFPAPRTVLSDSIELQRRNYFCKFLALNNNTNFA